MGIQTRKSINTLLRSTSYQIVKVYNSQGSVLVPPEILLDDAALEARITRGRKHAWIIAAPKSGSTWLSVILERLLGWKKVVLTGSSNQRREQEVDVRQMVRFPGENIFSPHQHCRASDTTVNFIKQFRVKPIIQVRDIYDSVVSFRDHCRRDGLLHSMAYLDGKFLEFSEEKQFHCIIDLVLPWYFNFYAGWFQVKGFAREELLFVDYDDLRMDTKQSLVKILDFLEEVRTEAEIERAMGHAGGCETLKNKAVSGRGRELLNDRHKERIRQLRQYYPHIDFSMVGL